MLKNKYKSIIICFLFMFIIFSIFIFFNKEKTTAQSSNSNLKIGFVNLKDVFKEYKKVKSMEAKLNLEMQNQLKNIKAIEEKVKQLREEIPIYRPGSDLRNRKEQTLTDNLFKIKNQQDRAKYYFAEKMKKGIEDIYREIIAEVESFARKQNFFMVVRVADADFFGAKSAEILRMQINTRDVLYWNKKHDITSIVIKIMNHKFEKESKSFKKQ